MFGDYISTSIRNGGNAFPIFPIASPPSGSTFTMGMFAPTGGLAITGGAIRSTSTPTETEVTNSRTTTPVTAF